MQTFLPAPDFALSARLLDSRRLGKQRLEAATIHRILSYPPSEPVAAKLGWRNHPAVLMWKTRRHALAAYHNAVIAEWISRGYVNNMPLIDHPPSPPMPCWLGDPAFHKSHQSNLIRKLPAFYGPLFPGVPDDLPYLWPSHNPAYASQLKVRLEEDNHG